MVKGILLDIDGTLVLSNDEHAHAWTEAFKQHGYDVPYEKIRPLIGMGGDKLMPTAVEGLEADSDVGQAASNTREKIFLSKYAPNLHPTPGCRELLEKLIDSNIQLIVASSAKRTEKDALLKTVQIENLLPLATTSDDAEESKPEPDIVEVALQKIQMQAQEVLMIGDTPYDIEAATKANVKIVAVRCGGWKDADLSGAIKVYEDPADILQHYDEFINLIN